MKNKRDRKLKIVLYIILYAVVAYFITFYGLIANQFYIGQTYDKVRYAPNNTTVYVNFETAMYEINPNNDVCSRITVNNQDKISDFEIWKDKIVYLPSDKNQIIMIDKSDAIEYVKLPEGCISDDYRVIGNKNGVFFINKCDGPNNYYMPFKDKIWIKIDDVYSVISQSESSMSLLRDSKGKGVFWDTDTDIKNTNIKLKTSSILAYDFKNNVYLDSKLQVKRNDVKIGSIKMPLFRYVQKAYVFADKDEVWISCVKVQGSNPCIYVYQLNGTYKGTFKGILPVPDNKKIIKVGDENIQLVNNDDPLKKWLK
jgi:hypothetical protein